MSEPPLAIELIDKEIAKHEEELKKHLAQREHAQKDVQIQQDCIDMYSSFILDLQQSKEAILAAQEQGTSATSTPTDSEALGQTWEEPTEGPGKTVRL